MSKGLPRSQRRGAPRVQEVYRIELPNLELDLPFTGSSGVGYGSTVLAELPMGMIHILSVNATLSLDASVVSSGIIAAWNGDISIGSAAVTSSAKTLASARADVLSSSATTVAATKVSPTSRYAKVSNNIINNMSATRKNLNLNINIDDASVSGNGTMKAIGSISIACIVL